MNLTNQQVELIEKYLRDDLSEKESQQFNEQLNDANFKSELMDQAKIIHGIELGEDELLRKRLKGLSQTSGNQPKVESPIGTIKDKKSSVNKLIIAVALVLLALAAFFYFQQNTKEDRSEKSLYASYYQAYPVDEIQRGNNDIVDPNYTNAMLLYAEGNYDACLLSLSKIQNPDEKVKMYRAACLIETGKHSDAIPILKELESSKELTIRQSSEWYQALSYLKLNDEIEMSAYLDRIVTESSHPFNAKAKRLKADFAK